VFYNSWLTYKIKYIS